MSDHISPIIQDLTMKLLITIIILMGSCHQAFSQSQEWSNTPDSVALRLLDLISVDPGERIDTAAVRTLFYSDAYLHVLYPGDEASMESIGLNQFLEMLTDPYYEAGYVEYEISRELSEYGGIAHIFQRFGGRDSEGSEDTGMNSYQLAYYNDRWWIIGMLWTLDTEE